jgi:hypothetical protein
MSHSGFEYVPLDEWGDKYSGLNHLLGGTTDDFVTMTFREIEVALGSELPASARRHAAWWSNSRSHSQAKAWMDAGWQTTGVSLSGQRVSFTRVATVQGRTMLVPERRDHKRPSSEWPVVDRRGSVALRPQDRMNRVGLVGCVKKKRDAAAPAADLYLSPLFRGRRTYVEHSCERWFVLSALHGLVRTDEVLEPYDVTLNDASQGERQAWSDRVLRQIDAALGSCQGLTFEIHAGANYVDHGLRAGLQARGAKVERPAAGLRQGEQVAFYNRAAEAFHDPDEGRAGDAASFATTSGPDGAAGVLGHVPPPWQERDAWSALDDLDVSPNLVPARDWPAGVACLDRPGLYAWWVDEAGAVDLSRGLGLTVDPGRIYAGLAGATRWPSGKTTDHTLGRRIGQMHLGGKVRMSTFRWTLASVLFEQLGVQVQAAMVTSPASEEALTEWMREHLSVAVHPHDDRDTLAGLEHAVLERLDPPLNLRHMLPSPVRMRLTEMRRRISRDI